jgi:MFS family permease
MKYFVLVFLCSIAAIAYVQRLGMQTAYEPIQRDLQISTEQFGAIGTAWLVGYALMQVPTGWLADRWGSRNALVLFAVLWSILTGSIGLCQSFESLLVLWFLMGMTLAGVFPCAAKSIAGWFPDTQIAMASGLIGSSTLLGAALAARLTTWLLAQQSWQWIYVLYGSIGVLWACAYFVLIPAAPPTGKGPGVSDSHAGADPMTRADWRRLVSSLPMWLICGQQFFRAAGTIFFFNWFPKFLREARMLSQDDAGRSTMVVIVASMAGGILGGFFSDWLLRRTGLRRLSRQGIAIVGMTACSGLIFTTYLVADNDVAIVLFSLGGFIAAFGGVSGYTITIEFGGTRVATVFSIMNMSGNIGASLFNYLAGALQDRTGSWLPALLMFAGVFAVDAVCWACLNPRRPLFEDQAMQGIEEPA